MPTEGIDWIWFYWDGWRHGTIIKKHSDNQMTIQDCRGTKHRVNKLENGNWVAVRSGEFKGKKILKKKGKKDGKKKIKLKIKRKKRVKVKIKRRKLRKS